MGGYHRPCSPCRPFALFPPIWGFIMTPMVAHQIITLLILKALSTIVISINIHKSWVALRTYSHFKHYKSQFTCIKTVHELTDACNSQHIKINFVQITLISILCTKHSQLRQPYWGIIISAGSQHTVKFVRMCLARPKFIVQHTREKSGALLTNWVSRNWHWMKGLLGRSSDTVSSAA